ncbi:delta-lactam-biosynthetic de-N-acetylase [Caproiciproducens galactitolivorans]|uniref:delta-lactam-biosynthetic de-N-acetylase n=1 Tax=Caproiciproducens galactitolivorans TaxID=642589 RepID=UPI0038B2713D
MYITIGKKQIAIVLVCFVLLLAVVIRFNRPQTTATVETLAANTNWGLGYSENGKQPTGNASSDFLKQYNAYFVGSADKKVIYLTFDAGYEAGYTPAILDVLKKHNVKSAFFVVGNYLNTSPDLVKRMIAEGHIVGNHTNTHPDMSKISDMEAFKKEISAVEIKFKEIIGKDMQKYYRPPQGKYSVDNLKQANKLGYKTIFWSLAYVDWYRDKQPTKEQAFNKLLPRIHPGAVVLLHSTSKTNSEILDELLSKWEAMGYTFGTLHELAG